MSDTREQHRCNIRRPASAFIEPIDRLLPALAFCTVVVTVAVVNSSTMIALRRRTRSNRKTNLDGASCFYLSEPSRTY